MRVGGCRGTCERDGVPLALVSPCPTLDVLRAGRLIVTDRDSERRAWPLVEVVDRREDDPRTGLFSERVVRLVRWAAEPVRGADPGQGTRAVRRARGASCACSTDGPCPAIGVRVVSDIDQMREMRRGARAQRKRPSSVPERLRARAASDLYAVWINGSASRSAGCEPCPRRARSSCRNSRGRSLRKAGSEDCWGRARRRRVVVGTEAVLHRVSWADSVIFLDFDSELMASRLEPWRKLWLSSHARRGWFRGPLGDLQLRRSAWRAARRPDADAGASGDRFGSQCGAFNVRPRRARSADDAGSAALQRTGQGLRGGSGLCTEPRSGSAAPTTIEVIGPDDGEWRVVAPDHQTLCDLLAAVPDPAWSSAGRGRSRKGVAGCVGGDQGCARRGQRAVTVPLEPCPASHSTSSATPFCVNGPTT